MGTEPFLSGPSLCHVGSEQQLEPCLPGCTVVVFVSMKVLGPGEPGSLQVCNNLSQMHL